jgi:hypothetical protein
MSTSTAFATGLLDLVFNNTALAGIGSGLPASTTAGSLYLALHTANPGAGGNQSTSEATYTGYARLAVARSTGGWTISGDAYQNAAAIAFPAATAGSETETYFSIGSAATGAGEILLSGVLTTPLAVSSGITPTVAIGAINGTLT